MNPPVSWVMRGIVGQGGAARHHLADCADAAVPNRGDGERLLLTPSVLGACVYRSGCCGC
jgi:hypothetical protein